MRTTSSIAAAISLLMTAGAARAQLPRPSDALQPVEQTIADVNPLGTSTRVLRPDLRVPMDFSRVYRVPGSSRGVAVFGPADTDSAQKLQRVQGGIAAVFSASEYVKTKKGQTVPVVPAGTVYYIGGYPDTRPDRSARPSPDAAFTQVITAVDLLAGREPISAVRVEKVDPGFGGMLPRSIQQPAIRRAEQPDTVPTMPRASVLTDEVFRRQRVRELLMAAAVANAE